MNDILAVKLGIRTNWALHACCSRCSRYLRCWLIGTHQSLPFAVAVVWREQQGQLTERYFCFTKINGHNRKATHIVGYPNSPSALRRVEHDDSLPIRKPPQQWTVHEEEPTSTSLEDESGPSCHNVDPDFPKLTVPHRILQYQLIDLVTDLSVSKIQAEPLASYLQGWNLLQHVSCRKRQQ